MKCKHQQQIDKLWDRYSDAVKKRDFDLAEDIYYWISDIIDLKEMNIGGSNASKNEDTASSS